MARRIMRVAAALPNSNAPMPMNSRPRLPRGRAGPGTGSAGARASSDARRGARRSRWPRPPTDRDDREQDRRAHPDERDERQREERADDRSEVVHRPFEPVGASVGLGLHEVGQQGVAGRAADATSGPGSRAQDPDLQRGRREADRAREDGGRRVTTDRRGATPVRVIGQAPPASFAMPETPSATPSIRPNAEAGAPRVAVRKLGRSEVGTSCPTSERKLATPMAPAPA